ncbi:MAG: pilus assembly protein FimV [Piscirickettsiaceae bacterium]|nr:MAG: pilus assembly protein FimV [Piscirickettsiaceae bacterium]
MRHTKQTIAALCLINSASALALGVGDITTHSALNQVLNAKIPLVSSKNEDPTSISITLASRDVFKKAGIDRPQYLSDLNFTPVVSKNGEITINVTSNSSIKEPFVNFILDVEWPQGRTLKEFTILLDPPITMADITTAPVELAKSTTMTPVVSTVQSNTATSNTPAPAYNQSSAASEYGPTKNRDTLWGIAKNLISDNPSITHEQMMMALFENNPKAFYKKNINALMKGKVLSVPTNDIITQLSPKQARSAFNQQNVLWSTSANTVAQNKQGATVAANDRPAIESADPTLKLLTADKSAQNMTSNNESLDKNLDRSSDAIDQANTAIEMATTLEQENNEVKNRLNELETQVEKLQRLITLKDEQLAQLSAPAKVLANKPVDATVTPAENNEESETSNLPLYAGGGLLIALLGLYLARRKKNDDQAFPMPESDDEQHDLFAEKESSSNIEGDDEHSFAADAETQMETETGTNIEPEADSLFSEFSPSEFENLDQIQEADPLTECDVYIAYGRYQQAEDLIQKAITEDPANEAYKLKLLDVYFSAENSESFENLAKELVDIKRTNPDMWDNISTMGADICPESVLFVSPLREDNTADSLSEEIEPVSEEIEQTIEDNNTNIEEEIDLGPASFEITDNNIDSQEEIIADVPENTEDEEQKDDFEFEFDLVKPEPTSDTDESGADTSDNGDTEEIKIDDSMMSIGNDVDAKLSLAEAYIEMLDIDSAREALEEVIESGNAEQIDSAKSLLEKL